MGRARQPAGEELVRTLERLDASIDAAERAIEAEAPRLLALQSPVARDLSARTTPWPGDEHLPGTLGTLHQMVTTLRAASFPDDAALARQVVELDAVVDSRYEDAQRAQLLAGGQGHPALPEVLAAGQLWRSAERLGDHVKNVAGAADSPQGREDDLTAVTPSLAGLRLRLRPSSSVPTAVLWRLAPLGTSARPFNLSGPCSQTEVGPADAERGRRPG